MPDVSQHAAMALRSVVLDAADFVVAEPRAVRLRAVEPPPLDRPVTEGPASGRPALALRPATAADEPFLRRLFVDAQRCAFPADSADLDPLFELQYGAHSADRSARYPDAQASIIVERGESVGAITVHHEGGRTHLVELAVVSERRRNGVASAVLADLLATNDRVTLTVWEGNAAARRLYERHGFAVVAEQFGYLLMATHPER